MGKEEKEEKEMHACASAGTHEAKETLLLKYTNTQTYTSTKTHSKQHRVRGCLKCSCAYINTCNIMKSCAPHQYSSETSSCPKTNMRTNLIVANTLQ